MDNNKKTAIHLILHAQHTKSRGAWLPLGTMQLSGFPALPCIHRRAPIFPICQGNAQLETYNHTAVLVLVSNNELSPCHQAPIRSSPVSSDQGT